jgi:hypothetical protein
MRVLQNVFSYPAYQRRLDYLTPDDTFKSRLTALVRDGYNGVHLLDPVARQRPEAFLVCASDATSQRMWARENGMRADASEHDIVVAQIESHRAEVFYTQNPAAYGPAFHRRLPGCVRARICWHSPPARVGNLSGYDLVVNNFPASLKEYAKQGVRTAFFAPSYDPAMGPFSENAERDIDVVFAGGFSRYHLQRAAVLEEIAALKGRIRIVFALDRSRFTRLAESPLGRLLPLGRYRRPPAIRAVSVDPVFGIDMYRLFSRAKIVLNGAVDSAGADRGNMRCFEAMGCGAVMVSDAGDYPPGFSEGKTLRTYITPQHAAAVVLEVLSDAGTRKRIASEGLNTMRTLYSKQSQWQRFVELVNSVS